jgi:macrolide-specific efflux system membrane fusion protein
MKKIVENKKMLLFVLAFILLAFIVLKISKKDPIETTKVEVGEMIEATYAVGTVKAEHIFNLKTGVNTKMLERHVRIGQRVKKGQALVHLDSFPTYAAPFDGVITILNYDIGELVFSQSTVLTLVNDQSLFLELSLDEKSINKIKVGNVAKIAFLNQKKVTTGKVRAIFSNADSFYVHLDFDQSDLILFPGMTCDVSVITKKFNSATLIPLAAISPRETVKILNNENEIKLNIIHRDSKFVAVNNSELHEGDKLIVNKENVQFKSSSKQQSMGGH